MAKKRKDALGDGVADFIKSRNTGFTIDELVEMRTGIPIKPFALRWLLDSNVMFPGMIYMLAGEKGSSKTQLLIRLMRHMLDYDPRSLAFFTSTEMKEFPSQFIELLGPHAKAKPARFAYIPAAIAGEFKRLTSKEKSDLEGEAWTTILYSLVTHYRYYPHPVFLGLDTITGAPTESAMQDVMDAQGNVPDRSTNGMVRANMFQEWLSAHASLLAGTNIIFMATNHIREEIMGSGPPGMPPKKTMPGGKKLAEAPETVIYARPGKEVKSTQKLGRQFLFKIMKTSNGSSERNIAVDSYVPAHAECDEDGNFIDGYIWDWDQAALDILCSFFQAGVAKPLGPATYRDVVKIVKAGTSVNPTYTIKKWGMENATAAEVMAWLEGPTEEAANARKELFSLPFIAYKRNKEMIPTEEGRIPVVSRAEGEE